MSNVSRKLPDVSWQEINAFADMSIRFQEFERKVGKEVALRWLKQRVSKTGK